MRKTTFTITEDEIREVAFDMDIPKHLLSKEKIRLILDMVEGDEMLAKDINTSIRGSIHEALFE